MNIEEFIENSREEFEDKKLPINSKFDFKKQLKDELHSKPRVLKLYSIVWKVAAGIVLVLGTYTFGRYMSNNSDSIEVVEVEEKESYNEIIALVQNESPHRRFDVTYDLGQIENPGKSIINALIERLLQDDNVNVRFAALRGLENHINDDSVKKALIEALGIEKDSRIQISIIHLLISINEKRAVEPIKELLKTESVEPRVKEHISSVLPQLI